MAKNISVLYSLYPDKKEAAAAVRFLLRKKLIVCANILPAAESHYVWRGKIETSREVMVFFKTLPRLARRVRAEVESRHSYEVPLVVQLRAEAVNAPYLAYAAGVLGST